MRVRLLCELRGLSRWVRDLAPGEVIDLDDHEAYALVRAGAAELIDVETAALAPVAEIRKREAR